MNLRQFGVGDRVLLSNGATAQVVAPTEDGRSMRVRYLDSPFEPEQVGSEARCTEDQVVGVVETQSRWGERNGQAHNLFLRPKE